MKKTYPHASKNTSHATIGVIGRVNCRVIGMIKDVRKRVEMAVFPNGPGEGRMDREKMPNTASSRYCPS